VAIILNRYPCGKGDGTYQNVTGYNFNSNAYNPSAIAVGDLNGDGLPGCRGRGRSDEPALCASEQWQRRTAAWVGSFTYGFLTFSYRRQRTAGPWARLPEIAIGDVNGDARPMLRFTLAQFGDPGLASCNYTNQVRLV